MNELKAIAEINEEIKSIVYVAENISLTATNAMLVDRQAGINALGFSVVARAGLLRDLQITMRRTAKQCASDLVIAHSAGIEGAHGGAMTPVLRQIAPGVEDVVGNIAERVKKLESRLTEEGV